MTAISSDLIEDGMIAATARIHGLAMATRNVRDFANFEVEVANPSKLLSENELYLQSNPGCKITAGENNGGRQGSRAPIN